MENIILNVKINVFLYFCLRVGSDLNYLDYLELFNKMPACPDRSKASHLIIDY